MTNGQNRLIILMKMIFIINITSVIAQSGFVYPAGKQQFISPAVILDQVQEVLNAGGQT